MGAVTNQSHVMPAIRAALTERVVWVLLSDSNSTKDGLGWASGIGRALQARFGLWGTVVRPPSNGGGSGLSANAGAPSALHNKAGRTDGSDFDDSGAGGRLQGYLYSAAATGSDYSDNFFEQSAGGDYKMNFGYTDDLQVNFTYGGGMGPGGSFHVYVRGENPQSGYTDGGPFDTTAGTLGTLKNGTVSMPAASRDGLRIVPGGFGTIAGPFFMDTVWVERVNLTSGFLHQVLVSYGGHGLKAFYDFALDGGSGIGNPSAEHLLSVIMARANAAGTKFVFWINSGLNDRNAADPSAAGFSSNSANIEAWLEARVTAAGGSSGNCYFIHCPSHPVSNPDDAQLTSYRSAVATLSNTHARSCAVDISQLITSTQMLANGYFASAGADTNHLVEAGYVAIGKLIVDQFVVPANPSPALVRTPSSASYARGQQFVVEVSGATPNDAVSIFLNADTEATSVVVGSLTLDAGGNGISGLLTVPANFPVSGNVYIAVSGDSTDLESDHFAVSAPVAVASTATADQILENALAPKRVSGDSGSVEQHSIPDQIEADRYAKSKAASRIGLGIRMVKLIPPGAD